MPVLAEFLGVFERKIEGGGEEEGEDLWDLEK